MLEMNSSARQRKESKKSAKTAKQQSRNQSEKKHNENGITIYVQKSATSGEKTQGKHRTSEKK